MSQLHSSPTSTTRYQIYCPRGLKEDFEAYVQRHDLTFAEGGRRAIRLLLKHGDAGQPDVVLGEIERRIATTLSQHGERHSKELEEVLRLLQHLLSLTPVSGTRQSG